MNQPWICMYFPSRSPLPPPSPPDPSGSFQCTRPQHLLHASNLGRWSVSPYNSFRISHTSHPPFLPSQVLFFSISSSTSRFLLHWSFSLWNQVLHFCLHSFLISYFFIYKISKNYIIPMEERKGLRPEHWNISTIMNLVLTTFSPPLF